MTDYSRLTGRGLIEKLNRIDWLLRGVLSSQSEGGGGAVSSVAGKTGVVTLVPGDVGLANVNNTSDANKPISSATQTALDLKADSSTVTSGLAGKQNVLSGTGFVKIAGSTISYDNSSYSLTSHTHTASQITDFVANARTSISLTTTGSGAATYNSTTGVLNIPTPAGSTIDSVPTDGSANAVSSDGVFDALALKANTFTTDATPTSSSTNPVQSGGVFTALAAKANNVITGYTSSAGTVAATDTVLQAIQKLNGNDALKAPLASPTFTGNVVIPALYGQTASAGFINIQGTTNATKGKVWLNSAIQTQFTTLSATTTITFSHTIVWGDATTASFTLNLPTATSSTGVIYMFKKIDTTANTITIDPNGAETIDGAATYLLREQDDAILIQSNGTVWRILMKSTRNPQAVSPNGTLYRINVSDAGVVSTATI